MLLWQTEMSNLHKLIPSHRNHHHTITNPCCHQFNLWDCSETMFLDQLPWCYTFAYFQSWLVFICIHIIFKQQLQSYLVWLYFPKSVCNMLSFLAVFTMFFVFLTITDMHCMIVCSLSLCKISLFLWSFFPFFWYIAQNTITGIVILATFSLLLGQEDPLHIEC